MREEKEKRNHKLTRHDKDGALQGSLVAWSRRVSSVDQRWLCCTHGVPLQLQRWDPILYNPFKKKTPKHLPLKKPHQFIKKFIILSSSPHHVFVQLCVCTRGGTTHWVKPGWTTLACNAPVCTLLGSVAVRREYTNRRCDLVSRCQQFLNRMV